jgi:dihydrofolate reductase
MKATVYIATSLDGYIARENGDLDWLLNIDNAGGDDYGYADFIGTIDALVMGRGTFEKVLSFPSWPYDRPVYVLSTTLTEVPEHLRENVHLISMPVAQAMQHVSELGHASIYVDGGKTIQEFLRSDLIDELIVTRIPVLIGSGIPLFGPLERDVHFHHVETTTYSNGLVKSHYRRRHDS